jgi:hypothetical protein
MRPERRGSDDMEARHVPKAEPRAAPYVTAVAAGSDHRERILLRDEPDPG